MSSATSLGVVEVSQIDGDRQLTGHPTAAEWDEYGSAGGQTTSGARQSETVAKIA